MVRTSDGRRAGQSWAGCHAHPATWARPRHAPPLCPPSWGAGLTLGAGFTRHTLPAFAGWEVQLGQCRLSSVALGGVSCLHWAGWALSCHGAEPRPSM